MPQNHTEFILDLSGLLCPLPVLKARKRLLAMNPGEVLVVTATDPMAIIDIPHFCNEQGHELENHERMGDKLIFRIKRK